ncbi:MAG: hypothetical protein ACOYD5_07070 [Negativicutes bacterium]|jgi:hypothetical protein
MNLIATTTVRKSIPYSAAPQTKLLKYSNAFGLNEIKNKIRFIENQSSLLTNEIFRPVL